MNIKNLDKINVATIFAIILGSCYLYATLYFKHYLPSARGMDVGLVQNLFVSALLLFIWVFKNNDISFRKLTISVVVWLSLGLLLLLQPLLNSITYIDGMLFSIDTLFVMALVAYTVSNIKEKDKLIHILSYFMIMGGFLQLLTLLGHLFQLTALYDVLLYSIPPNARPIGNIAQPNQVAFILSMSMASCFYLIDCFSENQNKYLKFTYLMYLLIALFITGIAITGSRGGLILGGFSVLFMVYFNKSSIFKNKFQTVLMHAIAYLVFYIFGSFLLDYFNNTPLAVERINTNASGSLRLSQLYQAWLIFKDNLITGIGWGNYAQGGIQYFKEISWFNFTDHSHMIVSQIASELGLLGLLVTFPVIYIVLRNFFGLFGEYKDGKLSYNICIISIILLYSLLEFPLWYYIYLLLFTVFLATIDYSIAKRDFFINRHFIVLFLSINFVSSCYYYNSYMKYAAVTGYILEPEVTVANKLYAINSLPKSYGFLKYKEMMVYLSLPVSKDSLSEHIKLGEKVVSSSPSNEFLGKQAALYALGGQKDKALTYLKATCLYGYSQGCDDVNNKIKVARDINPEDFGKLYDEFLEWRHANPEKTRLKQNNNAN